MVRIKISLALYCFLGFISTLLVYATAYSADALITTSDIHTRTLAASCAACHGTNGNSRSTTPVLANLDATHFITQMQAFKNNSRSSTVMHHHAAGLNENEIEQLAHYFSQQKRMTTPALEPQVLEINHDQAKK